MAKQMEEPSLHRREVNRINTKFHNAITAAAGNTVLTGFARSTDINYWTFATPVIFTDADDQRVNSEHHQLIDALEAGDSALASQIAQAHVMATSEIIARSLGISR